MGRERELVDPVDLCDEAGRLNRAAVGWSASPIHRADLPGSWGRRKRWDYWAVTGPECVLALTIADVDYLGLVDVWLLDLGTRRTFARSVVSPLGRGVKVPSFVRGASIQFTSRALSVSFTDSADGTRLWVEATSRNEKLEAEVFVRRPPGHESMSVVIPWSHERFQLTTKDVARPAEGQIQWKDQRYTFDAEDGSSWAALDYGRGKWPYRTQWNWGAAAGYVEGPQGPIRLGLQLGGKWTAGTGMTENAFCVDGRIAKLSEELEWRYDTRHWLLPWTIRAPSGRVDLRFSPTYDKRTRIPAGIASARVDQCFGTYSGTVVDDAGRRLHVERLFGWAEEATWRW